MSVTVSESVSPAALSVPTVTGAHLNVPLVTGEQAEYANLDHAASAPCLEAVRHAIDEMLPWYASVHRGTGFASQVSTSCYEQARDTVRHFVGAKTSDVVVFTRNTTDSFNLLARCLPKGTAVVVFDTDHHAALLPWRGPNVHRVHTPRTQTDVIAALGAALSSCPEGPRLVVVTGASNVTGELWPVRELAEVAHRYGARIALDAAQLAPHRPTQIQEWDVDYVAISGHKLYAPFGAGALIGRADWLQAADPYLVGGGATKSVIDWGDHLGVTWAAAPERHEAGSPNVIGVYALAAACDAITQHGWDLILGHEQYLLQRLNAGLASVPGLRKLTLFDDKPETVGVISFAIDGHDSGLLAAALSAEYGIGIRDGAFCAHVATHRLLQQTGASEQRALRASVGFASTPEHVDRLVDALGVLIADGPKWTYRQDGCRWVPEPDSRAKPLFVAR